MEEQRIIDEFADAIFKPDAALPTDVTARGKKAADKRYNVYRNNATASLVSALADIFPAICKITGDDFFRAMAAHYVRSHPPKSPLLFLYGQDFADFLVDFAPAQSMPYLPDVARLEREWLTAFHAADRPFIDPQMLSLVDHGALPAMTFKIHPATKTVSSGFPIFDIFAMNRNLMPLGPVDLERGQSVLVTRPYYDVQITHINVPTVRFLSLLASGLSFGEAAGETLLSHHDFDLAAALSVCLSQGAFSAMVA